MIWVDFNKDHQRGSAGDWLCMVCEKLYVCWGRADVRPSMASIGVRFLYSSVARREEDQVLCWRRLTNLTPTGWFRFRLRTSNQIGTRKSTPNRLFVFEGSRCASILGINPAQPQGHVHNMNDNLPKLRTILRHLKSSRSVCPFSSARASHQSNLP